MNYVLVCCEVVYNFFDRPLVGLGVDDFAISGVISMKLSFGMRLKSVLFVEIVLSRNIY